MSVWDSLLEALDKIGYVADTPGAYTRGVLAGKPGQRVGGREMLEAWGAVGPNQEGLDSGDVAGFAAEMLADPLNLVGGGLAKAALKHAGKIKQMNKISEAMRAAGAMPEELIQHLHPSMVENGIPKRVYHGTKDVFDKFDLGKADASAQYGKGIYTTLDPEVASSYTTKRGPYAKVTGTVKPGKEQELAQAYLTHADDMDESMALRAAKRSISNDTLPEHLAPFVDREVIARHPANVRMHYLDVRNPLNVDELRPPKEVTQNARAHGYDAIMHEGGRSMGKKPHQVVIALDQSQVYSPYVAPALKKPHHRKVLSAMLAHNLMSRRQEP